jgi:RNA polymerase sigma-70 factor (ECF subfamily)
MSTLAASPGDSEGDITRLLRKMAAGDHEAAGALAPLIYNDLRRVARNYIRGERIGHTLQPTALVNEAFIRIVGMQKESWQNRTHFIAVAATLMRHILIDYARARTVRPNGHVDPNGDEALARLGREQAKELVTLHDALDLLEKVDPRQARIVELRFFGGLSVEEIAQVLNLSDRTVKREWAAAKVWLHEEMSRNKRR